MVALDPSHLPTTNAIVNVGVTAGDGLEGEFYWDSANVTATNLNVFKSTASGSTVTGRWVRMNSTVSSSASGGNRTINLRKSLKLRIPMLVDGAGCAVVNTNDATLVTWLSPRFSGSAVSNANYCVFGVRVPKYISTNAEITASLSVRLSNTDTGAQTYHLGMASIANGSPIAGTGANFTVLTIPADASGASGDVESVSDVSLTGWAAAATAGQWWYIELRRAGSTDASTVASDLVELEINYSTSE